MVPRWLKSAFAPCNASRLMGEPGESKRFNANMTIQAGIALWSATIDAGVTNGACVSDGAREPPAAPRKAPTARRARRQPRATANRAITNRAPSHPRAAAEAPHIPNRSPPRAELVRARALAAAQQAA